MPRKKWTVRDADEMYRFSRWGKGFFVAGDDGNLCATFRTDGEDVQISITSIIEEMEREGINLPAVIRFPDILRNQVTKLATTFSEVIAEAGYGGKFFGVYPVKVNHMRRVVEEIVEAGRVHNFGLEVGSKSELLLAMGMNTTSEALTVINGYKDMEMLRLAMMWRKLGSNSFIVLEKISELEPVFQLAEEMGVEPQLGVRAKLHSKGMGRWAGSTGERGKFGLSSVEIMDIVRKLRERGKLHWLRMVHFHIGSQIAKVQVIKDSVIEGARVYASLTKMGVPLAFINVGGGLGVDYLGAGDEHKSSLNYSTRNYVENIVYNLQQICDLEGVGHPNIVTESGRFITALHSLVVTKVIDRVQLDYLDFPDEEETEEHILLTNFRQNLELIDATNYHDVYYDVITDRNEAQNAFRLGVINLEERARIDALFWQICRKINKFERDLGVFTDELSQLKLYLSPQYICNFSVFQSIPDNWAIGQLFPVAPLVRLHEAPTIYATLADITCDSDGKLDSFIHTSYPNDDLLPLHELRENEDYYLGIFMTGAYQEVIGSIHNLLGRVNQVNIRFDHDGESNFYFEDVIEGTTAQEVLNEVEINEKVLFTILKKRVEALKGEGSISPRESVRLLDMYTRSLRGHTYLNR